MDELAQIAADVSVQIGWEVQPSDGGPTVHLTDRRGHTLVLWASEGRVTVIGRRAPGTVGSEHITTAAAETPRVLAAVRRILPGYVADYDAGVQGLADRVVGMSTRLATAERLRPLVPGAAVTADHLYVRWTDEGIGRGRITVGDDGTVRLEVAGLPAETCAAMLDAMIGATR